MSKSATKMINKKIKTFAELEPILQKLREEGEKIVQCHGIFDLLHPGHIRHFKEAKLKGSSLIVSLTPDCYVNKGPGRPAFTETLRLESIAALSDVDYVVLNDTPDAVQAIERISPHFYAKGIEYQNHNDDLTGKIVDEADAVEKRGGSIVYTDDLVFSSSSLLNRYFDSIPPKVLKFMNTFKEEFSTQEIIKKIDDLSSLNVLVIGDAIIDEYQYTQTLGQSGKGQHMVARCQEKEVYLGGSLIIANHLANFSSNVTLMTAIGQDCPYLNFIRQQLAPNVSTHFAEIPDVTTLIKKRYVMKDGKSLVKLFETYSAHDDLLNEKQTEQFIDHLQTKSSEYDLVVVSDFGNGFTNQPLIEALSDMSTFLALNTQINSGNRGYNVVTNYRRADYISLNEPELRLSAHNQRSPLEGLITDIGQIMNCNMISITRGVKGALCYQGPNQFNEIPPFATSSIDRVGAGDSFLALSSLCLAKKYSPQLAGFVGSIAAAMGIQNVGNQESIKKEPLLKFITRLMK